jgi:hypothetical protein
MFPCPYPQGGKRAGRPVVALWPVFPAQVPAQHWQSEQARRRQVSHWLTDLFPLTMADGLTIWPMALLYFIMADGLTIWPTALFFFIMADGLPLADGPTYLTLADGLSWPTAYYMADGLILPYSGRRPYFPADGLILLYSGRRPCTTLLWPTALLSGRLPYSTSLWPTALLYLTLADGPILPYSGRRPYYPADGLSLLCSGRRPYSTLLRPTALLSGRSALLYTFLADGPILADCSRILAGGLIPHYSGRRPY